jgi:hypothetical protein
MYGLNREPVISRCPRMGKPAGHSETALIPAACKTDESF